MKYFSYDPEDSFRFHATAEEAKKAAEQALDYCRDEAPDPGWPETTDRICWGEIKECVTMTKEIVRPTESELDENQFDAAGNDWSNDFSALQEFELLPSED